MLLVLMVLIPFVSGLLVGEVIRRYINKDKLDKEIDDIFRSRGVQDE